MDTEQMIVMARERAGWHVDDRDSCKVRISNEWRIHCGNEVHAHFIANAPATIVALAERVAELEAQLAAMGDTVSTEEITVVEARMEAQRKRLMRYKLNK